MSYRTTISIPEDLKEQMDAIGDGVNWSAIAARAFQAKVFEMQARKGGKMKKADIVKRRKAGQEADSEDYDDGKAAGRAWAEQQATPKELQRLATYLERAEADPSSCWWNTDPAAWNAPWGAADHFVFA